MKYSLITAVGILNGYCNYFPGYFSAHRFEINFYTCSKRKWWLVLPFSDLFLSLSPLKLAASQACQLQVTQSLVLDLMVLPSLILHFFFLFLSVERKKSGKSSSVTVVKMLLRASSSMILGILKKNNKNSCYQDVLSMWQDSCYLHMDLLLTAHEMMKGCLYCNSKIRCW